MFLMAGFGWGRADAREHLRLKWGVLGPVAVAAAGPLEPPRSSPPAQPSVARASRPATCNSSCCSRRSATLFVFNLIPIPPLDGAKVIFPFLPRSLNSFVSYEPVRTRDLLGLVLLTFLPMLPSPLSYILVLVRPVLSTLDFPRSSRSFEAMGLRPSTEARYP